MTVSEATGDPVNDWQVRFDAAVEAANTRAQARLEPFMKVIEQFMADTNRRIAFLDAAVPDRQRLMAAFHGTSTNYFKVESFNWAYNSVRGKTAPEAYEGTPRSWVKLTLTLPQSASPDDVRKLSMTIEINGTQARLGIPYANEPQIYMDGDISVSSNVLEFISTSFGSYQAWHKKDGGADHRSNYSDIEYPEDSNGLDALRQLLDESLAYHFPYYAPAVSASELLQNKRG